MSVPDPDDAARSQLDTLGVAQGTPLEQSMRDYLEMLLAANQHMNLTRITSTETMWQRQICDSLTLLPWLATLPADSEVVDLGSGGGTPGLPLALALPQLRFSLVESTGKKARFLKETATALGLDSLEVHSMRIEDFAACGGPGRARFAAATARALSALPSLVELAIPTLTVGGFLLAIKGARAESEIRDARQALGQLRSEVRERKRTETGTVVVVDKLSTTSDAFPRRTGEAQNRPL